MACHDQPNQRMLFKKSEKSFKIIIPLLRLFDPAKMGSIFIIPVGFVGRSTISIKISPHQRLLDAVRPSLQAPDNDRREAPLSRDICGTKKKSAESFVCIMIVCGEMTNGRSIVIQVYVFM